MTLELNSEEQAVLAEVLRTYLASLEVEIAHTDHREFKNLLKHRRELISGLLNKVQPEAETQLA